MATPKQKLSRMDVGAWVFKGNPDEVYDYFGQLEADGRKRGTVDESGGWTLGSTYRTELIQKGDLVVLWITGSQLPGIHEIGVITGEVGETVIDDEYLIDDSRRDKPVYWAPFRMLLLEHYIAREDMKREPALSSCEQFRAPMITNPTYLTPDEVNALTAYIPDRALKAARWTTRLKKLPGKS